LFRSLYLVNLYVRPTYVVCIPYCCYKIINLIYNFCMMFHVGIVMVHDLSVSQQSELVLNASAYIAMVWRCIQNCSLIPSNTILKWPHLKDFYEQANYIRGRRSNFIVTPRPSNSLLAILKAILEVLEQWTNMNPECGNWTFCN
jgi:hypothetical protein